MNSIAARRLEEKERRRSDILDAAHRVATASGIEGLTMERVAREARLSRGLLYVYFRDRTDLHLGLCERALAIFQERAVTAAAGQELGLDKLTAIGRAYVCFAQDCPTDFEALVRFESSSAAIDQAEGNLPACLAASARVHALMISQLEIGRRDGSIAATAGEPNTVAVALWALMHGAIQITRLKAGVLAQQGVTPEALINQALGMAAVALSRG